MFFGFCDSSLIAPPISFWKKYLSNVQIFFCLICIDQSRSTYFLILFIFYVPFFYIFCFFFYVLTYFCYTYTSNYYFLVYFLNYLHSTFYYFYLLFIYLKQLIFRRLTLCTYILNLFTFYIFILSLQQLLYYRMSLYTTFTAFLSLDNTNMFSREVTLERATYSWPCEKQSTLKSKPATLKV